MLQVKKSCKPKQESFSKTSIDCFDETSVKKSKSSSPHNPINVEKCEEKPINYWVKDLGLHMGDKDAVCSGDWLSAKHISAMNKLLAAQFPVCRIVCY